MKTKSLLNRAVWLYLGLALVLILGMAFTGYAQAQEPTPRPRPGEGNGNGNGGSRGGGPSSDSDDGSAPLSPKTGVYGFVYNYSTAGYEGGVQVVATGNGWQAETVTDSNGYYQLRELGFGKAILNLRLPPEAHPAAPNWPITLVEPEGHQVDLGFYWRSPDSIPVRLSGALERGGEQLVIELKNNTDQPASGGLVEIITPPHLAIAPAIETSQGHLANYAAHRTQVEPGGIMPGKTVTINVNLNIETEMASEPEALVQVLFTYHEQISPQALELELKEHLLQADLWADEPEANLLNPPQAEPSTAPAPAQNEAASSSRATPQPADSTSPATADDSAAMPAEESAETNSNSLLPGTGNETNPVSSAAMLTLTTLLLAVLGFGGWQSLRRQRM